MQKFRCCLAVLALTVATMAQAETRVDLTPSLAFLIPTTNVVDQDGATAKFASAMGFGGRLSIWVSESVALEATGSYAKSSLEGEFLGEDVGSIGTGLFYGSAQVAVGLGASKQFMLHGGFGFQGSNYDELIEGGNIMSGVVGFSVWVPLSRTVAIRGDLDTYIHTQYFEIGDVQTDELNQYDVILSLGIQFSPDGR